MISYTQRYNIIFDNVESYFPGTFHAWTGCHLRLYVWCNELEIEYMFSSLRLIPRQWQPSLWFRRHSEVDILKSAISDFGRSFLSLVTSASTLSPRTEACTDVSVFHYLSDVASWMITHTQGKSARTLRTRIPPALATSSNLSNIPLTQPGPRFTDKQ